MNSEAKDGGPAFPGAELPEHPNHPNGMTLRDWFAGQALAPVMDICRNDTSASVQYFAEQAYRLADAMLSARQQKDENDGR